MKGSGKDEEEWAFVGEWSVEEPYQYKGMDGDKGLVVKNAAAHHAISAKFPKKIDNKGKTLVVQYEVKLQSKFYTASLLFDTTLCVLWLMYICFNCADKVGFFQRVLNVEVPT